MKKPARTPYLSKDALEAFVDIIGGVVGLQPFLTVKAVANLISYIQRSPSEPIHDAATLENLDVAAGHMRNAIASIEELKAEYQAERDRLQRASADADAMNAELRKISHEKNLAAELRAQNSRELQAVLGLDEINKTLRQGKLSGFVAGVLASLIAWGLSIAIELAYKHYRQEGNDSTPTLSQPSHSAARPTTQT